MVDTEECEAVELRDLEPFVLSIAGGKAKQDPKIRLSLPTTISPVVLFLFPPSSYNALCAIIPFALWALLQGAQFLGLSTVS